MRESQNNVGVTRQSWQEQQGVSEGAGNTHSGPI